jgi:branched-chain amino acid transport system substrate-binding protein
VSPSNTAAGLTAPEKHQAFYARTAQNDAIQAKVVSDFVSGQLKLTKVATIHDESPYAAGLTGGFKTFFEKAGGTVTSEQAISSKDTDFTALLTTIAQTSPQLIYLPDFNPGCALIAKQAATIPGLSGVKLMGSDGCLDTSFFDIAGPAGNGFYTSGPIPSPGTTTSDLVAKYTKAYKADYGDPTASFNQNAFDAFNILMEAVKKVAINNSDGSLSIPRSKLRDALFATKDWQGLTGNVTCNQYGDCQSVATVNIGVYLEPQWPIKGGDPSATPVYSEKLTLAQALGA